MKEKPGEVWSATARFKKGFSRPEEYRMSGKAGQQCIFDELFIDNPYIHVEQLNKNTWFVALGDDKFWVTYKKGKTHVDHEGEERG